VANKIDMKMKMYDDYIKKQQSNKATKQQSNKATKQQSNEKWKKLNVYTPRWNRF